MQGIYALMRQHCFVLTDAHKWRTTPPLRGHITGLFATEGTLLATNGVLCLIHRAQHDVDLLFGHLDSFEVDRPEERASLAKVKEKTAPTVSKVLDDRYDDI